ncbi:MAG: dihydrofolate reductase [Nanoarchaeota archaeon]
MKDFNLTLFAEVSLSKIISDRGRIPWNISEADYHFRKRTLNHPCIMGRGAYEYFLEKFGQPFDRRGNIVVSRTGEVSRANDIVLVRTLKDALVEAQRQTEYYPTDIAYVIGGKKLFDIAISLPQTRCLEVLWMNKHYSGDLKFPEIDYNIWKEVSRIPMNAVSFTRYSRK